MFGNAFLYILAVLCAADIYIFLCYIRKLTPNVLLRVLWFVPLAVIASGVYLFFVERRFGAWQETFTLVYLTVALPQICFAVVSMPDMLLRPFLKWKVCPFTLLGLAVALGVVFVVVYGGTAGPNHFSVKEITVRSAGLSGSFDGYRIVQVSDIHLGNWRDKKKAMAKMVSLVNAQHPDAVMVTGDLVHHRADELDGVEDILSGIVAPDGVYSVMGNHDYGPYRRFDSKEGERRNLRDLKMRQARMGWRMLDNAHTFISRDGNRIAVIGVENGGSRGFADYSDLSAAMKGTEGAPFKILLSHDPTHWRREVVGSGIDLTLSGHTHAGQFVLAGFSFSSSRYDEWGGMYQESGQTLYVNAGIGQTGLRFRFGAWPEITVITLRGE